MQHTGGETGLRAAGVVQADIEGLINPLEVAFCFTVAQKQKTRHASLDAFHFRAVAYGDDAAGFDALLPQV